MRIDRLYIKNFKGFTERTLDFHPSFNLIVGDNGEGKTSVLDALSVAVGSWFLGISGYKSRVIQLDEAHIKTRFLDKKFEPTPQYPVVISAHGCVQGMEMDWTRSVENVGRSTTYKGALNIKAMAESVAEAVMHGEPVTLPVISYYGAGRLWQEPRDMGTQDANLKKLRLAPQDFANDKEVDDSKTFSSRLVGYRFSTDPRCSPRDLIKWMRHERRIELDEEIKSTGFRLVLDAIKICLPGHEKVRYSIRNHSLMLDIPDRGIVAFNNLSDGYRNIVAMVGDLAYKISQLNPHLENKALKETPGVVLIDELDLHLHPKWQRLVIEALRRTFPKIQFFCTTHSPFLIQTLRTSEELVMLEGRPTDELNNLGIEAIAAGIMGVPDTETSPRYMKMLNDARAYLAELDEAAKAPKDRLAEYERQLAAHIAPYPDNPAFQAVLEAEKKYKLGK
ncbi:MAG: hypothetical protein A2075_13865 [Geobacteraceae bacterium GWC2_58_44]|nr:MAG: hypothetical protein A2075_13865 [Geobacteraceae bacterium GWC2_58_44]